MKADNERVRADTVIVDDEGNTIETHTSFLQAVLRRAALLRTGESPRLYYVRDDGVWRVIFPYGDYAGWSFRKVKEIRGSK